MHNLKPVVDNNNDNNGIQVMYNNDLDLHHENHISTFMGQWLGAAAALLTCGKTEMLVGGQGEVL